MKITKRQLRRIIREQTEPTSPAVQAIVDQMEDLSIDEIRVIWTAAADTTKRKRNEIKSGLKKGTRVAWDHSQHGREVTGTVVRRGGKFVIVQPDGDTRTWKKWPDSLRVIA